MLTNQYLIFYNQPKRTFRTTNSHQFLNSPYGGKINEYSR